MSLGSLAVAYAGRAGAGGANTAVMLVAAPLRITPLEGPVSGASALHVNINRRKMAEGDHGMYTAKKARQSS